MLRVARLQEKKQEEAEHVALQKAASETSLGSEVDTTGTLPFDPMVLSPEPQETSKVAFVELAAPAEPPAELPETSKPELAPPAEVSTAGAAEKGLPETSKPAPPAEVSAGSGAAEKDPEAKQGLEVTWTAFDETLAAVSEEVSNEAEEKKKKAEEKKKKAEEKERQAQEKKKQAAEKKKQQEDKKEQPEEKKKEDEEKKERAEEKKPEAAAVEADEAPKPKSAAKSRKRKEVEKDVEADEVPKPKSAAKSRKRKQEAAEIPPSQPRGNELEKDEPQPKKKAKGMKALKYAFDKEMAKELVQFMEEWRQKKYNKKVDLFHKDIKGLNIYDSTGRTPACGYKMATVEQPKGVQVCYFGITFDHGVDVCSLAVSIWLCKRFVRRMLDEGLQASWAASEEGKQYRSLLVNTVFEAVKLLK
eukprot:symbB.v1.2.026032.t1/scaffold2572.1/size76036/2